MKNFNVLELCFGFSGFTVKTENVPFFPFYISHRPVSFFFWQTKSRFVTLLNFLLKKNGKQIEKVFQKKNIPYQNWHCNACSFWIFLTFHIFLHTHLFTEFKIFSDTDIVFSLFFKNFLEFYRRHQKIAKKKWGNPRKPKNPLNLLDVFLVEKRKFLEFSKKITIQISGERDGKNNYSSVA